MSDTYDNSGSTRMSRRRLLKLLALGVLPGVWLARSRAPQPAHAQQETPLDQQRIDAIAERVAAALSLDAAGAFVLDPHSFTEAHIDPQEIELTAQFVADLNAGALGLAYVESGAYVLAYGSAQAHATAGHADGAELAVAVNLRPDGLYLFLDSVWISRVRDNPQLTEIIVALLSGLLTWAIRTLALPPLIRQAITWFLGRIAEYIRAYFIPLLLQRRPTSIDIRIWQVGWPEERLYAGERAQWMATCRRDVGCRGRSQTFLPLIRR
jgi:hypothetical protein